MRPLAEALAAAEAAIRPCSVCGNLDTTDPCAICADPRRDRATLVVVETVGDLWALERAAAHRGLYHVLGGTLSAIAGQRPEVLAVAPLLARVAAGGVREVVLATSATVDGQTTAHYLAERLLGSDVAVTRLAHGVPVGGELGYLDEGTLAAALTARRPA